ncbi:FAD:protein FMN transferase [Aliikangiella coralliicola]|uniref:FAD:protein FMN transferase n=1 Tax=Aliikangiella coralliicola TaxID=2592383 RepID=A0A545U4Y7_9GAMM|nr:FAD:protein FMN transferase [Aliikangiella coralliicola]TQV84535.1 FAD:protein FMN transferase [Aliikangiella coralliicola]
MSNIRKYLKAFASGLVLLVLAQGVNAQWFNHSFEVMGTQAKVEFEHSDEAEAQKLIAQVVDEMHRIDRAMSPYKESSELSKVNREAAIKPVVITPELFQLLQRSLYFSRLTNGAFDISFSSVGYLYDYRESKRPDEKQITELKDYIDYRRIQLDESKSSVFFTDKRVKIDLGGIGKGHAVDRCIQILQKAGVKNAYVNSGGDSRLIGKKADRLWYIGIKHPRDENKLIANLPLEEISLSTSGDYERFFEEDGVRYHHIIDPKTGKSAWEIQSATILANDSTTADALSTSIFVLGVEKGMALVNNMPDVSAIMVNKHGKLFISKDLASSN